MKKPTPLEQLKQEHGSKADLVDKLADKLETFDEEDTAEFRDRLLKVSNKKLLRLHQVCTRVESEFGNKKTLVDALIKMSHPSQIKDDDYKNKLLGYRVTRLLDMHDSARRATSA